MINKLISNIRKTNAPIVVGLDPMLNYIPEHIQKKAFAEFGETLEGAAEAIWQYNKGIVDATCDLIPAVKPQIAMYEQFGIPGLIAYKKTVEFFLFRCPGLFYLLRRCGIFVLVFLRILFLVFVSTLFYIFFAIFQYSFG